MFGRAVRVRELVSHRLPIERAVEAFALAMRAGAGDAQGRPGDGGDEVRSVTARMKAAVLHGREDVRIEQVDVPRLEPGDVLLRTQVALTCGTDVKVYRRGYHARMITPPSVFGHEVAGIVEEVGPGVEGVAPGTAVVVANSAPCGECHYCRHDSPSLCDDLLFWNGAYAEFARIPARVVRHNLVPLEEGVGFREAAMVEPLACVVRGVEESWIGRGQSVAVIGAGPIGLMFVALARLRGAHVDGGGAQRGPAAEGPRARGGGDDRGRRRAATSPSVLRREPPRPRAGRGDRGGGAARDLRGRDPGRPQGRGREPVRGVPGRHPDRHRLPAAPLPGADDQVDLPPHAGERPQGLPADRRRRTWTRTPSSPARRPSTACPRCCSRMARGGDGLKTAILTWGRE